MCWNEKSTSRVCWQVYGKLSSVGTGDLHNIISYYKPWLGQQRPQLGKLIHVQLDAINALVINIVMIFFFSLIIMKHEYHIQGAK